MPDQLRWRVCKAWATRRTGIICFFNFRNLAQCNYRYCLFSTFGRINSILLPQNNQKDAGFFNLFTNCIRDTCL